MKRKDKGKIYIAIFVAFLMITSIAGFLFGESPAASTHELGHKFTRTSEGWKSRIDGKDYIFSFLPSEVGYMNIENQSLSESFQKPMIYVTYNPKVENPELFGLAQFEIAQFFTSRGVYVVNGFTNITKTKLPVVTCANATVQTPVLLLNESGNPSIRMRGNCILGNGNPLQIADYIKYSELGLI